MDTADSIPQSSSSRVDPRAWALGLWIVLAIAASIKTLAAPEVHTVFPKFIAGAVHWWAGEPLYAEYEGLGDFRYSPTFALLMTPFAVLGLRLGGVIWSLVNIGAYVWGIRRLARDVLPGEWPPVREAALLLLAMPGAVRSLWSAQSNMLVAGCFMLAAAAVVRRGWWRAAVPLALAFYLKLSPIAVALLFAAIYPRGLGGPLLVALAVGALLPLFTRPPAYSWDQYVGWVHYLADTAGKRWPSFRDARTLWELLADAPAPLTYAALQVTTGLGVLAWCLWQQRRLSPLRELTQLPPSGDYQRYLTTLTLVIGVAYLMLFGPAVEFQTYALLAPLSAWAILEAFAPSPSPGTPGEGRGGGLAGNGPFESHAHAENPSQPPLGKGGRREATLGEGERREAPLRQGWGCPGRGRVLALSAYLLTTLFTFGATERALAQIIPFVQAALPVGTLLLATWLVLHCQIPVVRIKPLQR